MQKTNNKKPKQTVSINGSGKDLSKQVDAFIKLQEILLKHITQKVAGLKLTKHNAHRITRLAPRLPKGDAQTYSSYYLDFGSKEEQFIMEIWFRPGMHYPVTDMVVNVNAPIDVKEFTAQKIKELLGGV